MSDLMNDVKMDGGAARGTAEIDADLNGFVRAGDKPLADMNGTANLHLRNGEINKRMNVLFAIAQASDTLNPFRSRETIPFDTIEAPLTLAGGIAKTEALSLQGPAVRMVGTGQVDLVNDPHPVEAVIGVFFFRTLDRMIGMFPLLNRLLLGPDDNLIATYFAVTGPWGNTQGTLIPTKSIASGPASFVLEGLPSFVRGGLSTLERVVTGGPARNEATPPPRAAPPPAKEGGAS
jgi:AsmA-like protein